jgi:hypothetical protein
MINVPKVDIWDVLHDHGEKILVENGSTLGIYSYGYIVRLL